MPRAAVFEQTYHDYLERIGRLDLTQSPDRLGITLDRGTAIIPIFNRVFRVSARGFLDSQGHRAGFEACVILSRYLLHEPPAGAKRSGFAAFKDFQDAAPLVAYFSANAEGAIARSFGGRIDALEKACQCKGGTPYAADWGYQVKFRFQGLPRIPVYLLFNESEEGFPAQCTLLFERSAGHYLDMETLAMLGVGLAQLLTMSSRKEATP